MKTDQHCQRSLPQMPITLSQLFVKRYVSRAMRHLSNWLVVAYKGGMDDGPLIFLVVAAGILLLTVVRAQLFKKTIRKPMPGDDPRGQETHWYGGDGRD
ncbi:MAG: hypothetical protein WA921_04800 [Ahrensia sp.]